MDPFGAITAEFLKTYGGVGAIISALIATLIYVYRGSVAKDETIAALNKDLIEAAGRVEKRSAEFVATAQAQQQAIEAGARVSTERFDSLKGMGGQLVSIAQMVAINNDGIRRLMDDVAAVLRERAR